MTTRVLRTDIEPPAPQRWRIGLLENSGAQQLPPNAIQRLAGGVGYQALDPTLASPDAATFDPCADFEIIESEGGIVEWNAVGVSRGAECSTLNGADLAVMEAENRAATLLTNQSSYLTEYSFWTGIVGASTFAALGWPNIPLTNAATLTDLTPSDTEAGLVEGFGLINEYLSDTLRGMRGVIHVAPQLLPYLAHYRLAQRDGFTLGTTLSDHLVIAGSGYQGTGPGNVPVPNNRSWIYATSMVRVGQSPIETQVAVDRANNTAKAIAYRATVAEWDLTAHAGLRVCLTDPGPTCEAAGS
jgi:hypothetical protein